MADDDKDLPESAEEQYLQWVGQVQSESQQEGSQSSAVTGIGVGKNRGISIPRCGYTCRNTLGLSSSCCNNST